eukprot:gnl/Spiro4/16341_TR8769_c0_g1_i2.p1 gnl/Spiro4/16341_TR8769_c0_g1~~gnl/Spiro4/16341_TR8769_c0_g1_i2.p1  ORF type:complete len:154 (-),score=21.13 gnl/Spiro4/16341_TR8769_c0_g1_i2:55-516(-)
MAAKWMQLKLQPRMDVHTTADAYEVQSNIPGMDKKDINLQLNSDNMTLVVSGLRLPSPHEYAVMRRQLAKGRHLPQTASIEDEEELLLRLGAGRFGSFSTTFSLPNDVNVNGIVARYEAGVLRVVMPRIRPVHPPRPRHQAFPGFLDDRDLWW